MDRTHKKLAQIQWKVGFIEERKVIPKKILSFLQFRLVMTVRFILAGDGNQSISFLIWPEPGHHRRHRAATEPFILLISVQTRRGFCHRHRWEMGCILDPVTAVNHSPRSCQQSAYPGSRDCPANSSQTTLSHYHNNSI